MLCLKCAPEATNIQSLRFSRELRLFLSRRKVNIILRALKRAGIPVKFTQGFHPKPKVSFDNPLALGLESENEKMTLTVPSHMDPERVIGGLNSNLPEGLRILPLEDTLANSDENPAVGPAFFNMLSSPRGLSD